ncbi:MAG TPA: rhodanese-like domain-containing protein [Acidimicrobiia bacterium]|nr:rhodanese-like domain-containing protein [Acidimicrobiia bacterium]
MGTPKSFNQIVAEALASIPEVGPAQLQQRLSGGEPIVVIDVREPDEFAKGKIPGAYTIPRGVLEMQVDGRLPLDTTVVLYCGGGARSALAAKSLADMGYDKVENLAGGWHGWVGSGLPVEQA